MPCDYHNCELAFKREKGIKSEKCNKSFHRKCVKQSKHVKVFVCHPCKVMDKNQNDTSDLSSKVNQTDTSILSLSEYEDKILELEEEIKSLRLIIEMKDRDIHELQSKQKEKEVNGSSEDWKEKAVKGTSADQNVSTANSWVQVVSNNKHQLERENNRGAMLAKEIETENRYQVLQRISETAEPEEGKTNTKKDQRVPNRKKVPGRKSKVLLLADSNGRYCGNLLRSGLGSDFEVCSIFKPSAKMSQVIENVEQLTKDFTEQDTVIINAGSNDLQSKENEIENNVRLALCKINDVTRKTNVILNTQFSAG